MINKRSNVLLRFTAVIVVLLLACIYIVANATRTAFIDGSHWRAKADSLKIENIPTKPTRGNILATDGRILASTIPQYKVYIDFRADGVTKELFLQHVDSVSLLLSQKLKDLSPKQYKEKLKAGYDIAQKNRAKRSCLIYPKRISYNDLKELKQYPYFRLGPNRSGFHAIESIDRINPFGSLALRTIGDLYGDYDKGGKFGLELAFDSLLRGTPGISSRQKMGSRWIDLSVKNPVNGLDIRSTIDVDIQDIAEHALEKMLIKTNAESGSVVVMDVETGHIKAITNFEQSGGKYAEGRNLSVADLSEPGSTFKVASMIVALEAGIVEPDDTIDTGNGVLPYKGENINDHNKHKGGYGKITAAQSIWYSSNVGIAKIILKGYENRPADFVDALYKMGLNTEVDLVIPGAGKPIIRHPSTHKTTWYKTTLPWMSFGYETQIPPIYTLMLYNAIANDGKMIKPLFVEALMQNGKEIENFETETINPSICSSKTLSQIRQMLLDTPKYGTATAAYSPNVQIAGKTGTALISKGDKGYRAGGSSYRVSFAGYFPADNPKYSCIVVIRRPLIGYPSGGTMSGGVFKEIAEQIYAQDLELTLDKLPTDTLHAVYPSVLHGNYKDTKYVLEKFDIPFTSEDIDNQWIYTSTKGENIEIAERTVTPNLVPLVVGMGARDAVYLLESVGLQVRINGYGRVTHQSIANGTRIAKGQTITLTLK